MAEVIGTSTGTLIAGQRVATDVASARRKPQYIYPKTFKVNQNVVPLTQLLDKLGVKKEVGQATYNHLENDDLHISVTDSGSGCGSGVTTLNVVTGQGLRIKVGHVLKCLRTGEELRVTSIATDALTVTRGIGSVSTAAINNDEVLMIMSHADTDGNTAPRSITSEPSIVSNYCQIFRTAVEISGRDKESDNFGEDEWTRTWNDAMERHQREIECAFLLDEGGSSSSPFRTNGAHGLITTNVTDNLGADMTEGGWNTVLRNWLRRNQSGVDGSLFFFVGELLNKAITGYGRDGLRYSSDEKTFGISCQSYRAETGQVIKLVRHPLFSPLGSDETAVNQGLQGYGMGLNISKCGRVNFRNRIKKMQKDIETPGTDGTKAAILDDCGFWMATQKSHCLVTGVGG